MTKELWYLNSRIKVSGTVERCVDKRTVYNDSRSKVSGWYHISWTKVQSIITVGETLLTRLTAGIMVSSQ